MSAPVGTTNDFSRQNEHAFRQYVEGELAVSYRKDAHLVVPFGKTLNFRGVNGKLVTLGLNGSDQFTISIDGATAFALASDSSVSAISTEVIAARNGEASLSARIGTVNTTATTAGGVAATAQSEVTAARQGEVSLTAKVSQLAAATATVDGKLTASYSLTVDVNGRIASMKLLSNGTTSSVRFVASTFQIFNGSTDEAPFEVVGGVVKIKTANIGDLNANNITAGTLNVARINAGSIVTDKLAPNTVTQGSVSETDAAQAFGGSTWTTLAQVSVTTPDADTLIFLPFSTYIESDGSGDGSIASGRILRDATTVYETDLAGNPPPFEQEFTDEGLVLYKPNFNGQVSGFDTDSPGAAGSYTYYFQARTNGSAASWQASRRRLLALLFKR